MIRIELLAHLRTLARVGGEVTVAVDGPPTLGAVVDTRTYNGFGELETYAASPPGGGSPYLQVTYGPRDALGRIQTKRKAVS